MISLKGTRGYTKTRIFTTGIVLDIKFLLPNLGAKLQVEFRHVNNGGSRSVSPSISLQKNIREFQIILILN